MNKLIGFTSLFTHKKQLALIFCLLLIPVQEIVAHSGGGSHTSLSGTGLFRMQMLSFFIACFVFCSYFIKELWNYLKIDFSFLPKLSFKQAALISGIFGLFFLTVLSFDFGAGNLVSAETPATKYEAILLKIAEQEQELLKAEETRKYVLPDKRREQLEKLKEALWKYASQNEGKFPESIESSQFPDELWLLPEKYKLKYQYFPGLKISDNQKPSVLVSELDFYEDEQLVIQTDGTIHQISKQEWNDLQKPGEEK